MNRILGVIPSRYASSRFPGKPLVQIAGKSMIRRVYEQASQCPQLHDLIVATDDERIFSEVTGFGGKAMMTSAQHRNGTERCAEVYHRLDGYDYLINIQGDEPLIHPGQISLLAQMLNGETQIATLIKKVDTESILNDPSEIKVVTNIFGNALYFSRNCIPHVRGIAEGRLAYHDFYKHIGIYAFRGDVLTDITKLAPTALEMTESLEQLRWLEHGYPIKTAITPYDSQMIDTPEDLLKIKPLFSLSNQ